MVQQSKNFLFGRKHNHLALVNFFIGKPVQKIEQTKEEYVHECMCSLLGKCPETFIQEKPENEYLYKSFAAGVEQAYDLIQKQAQEDEVKYQALMRSWDESRTNHTN
jgi:hypothetical protein